MSRVRGQRGVALLVVLWACALLAVLLGGFALEARTEGLQARYQFAQTQARYAAEGGVARAVYALRQTRPSQRWMADGRPYAFELGGAKVRVRITDEGGKVDLNNAAPGILDGLLRAVGLDEDRAQTVSAAIQDWRDVDDASLPQGAEAAQYRADGRDYGPRNGPFASIEELQQVLGVDAALYAKLAPLITVWSGRNTPDPAHAPALVLQALPNMTADKAATFVRLRSQRGDISEPLPEMPEGMPPIGGGGQSITDSIRVEAVMPKGGRAVLNATVRLQGRMVEGPPYAVLHWQEGGDG